MTVSDKEGYLDLGLVMKTPHRLSLKNSVKFSSHVERPIAQVRYFPLSSVPERGSCHILVRHTDCYFPPNAIVPHLRPAQRRASSCGSGEFGGGEAHGFPQHSRRQSSVGSLVAGSGSGGGVVGAGGGGGGVGCPPLEGTIDDLLEELGLAKYLPVFRSAEVDLATLCIMSEQDFRELGILKGPRVKIMHHIGSR